MSYSFELYSHPDKLLKDHIANVFKNGQLLYEGINTEDTYRDIINLALLLHDVGKGSRYFQTYIKAIAQLEKEEISQDEFEQMKYDLGKNKNHSLISAIWTFIAIDQKLNDKIKALIGFLTVLKHHGHLDNLEDMLDVNTPKIQRLKGISKQLNYEEYQQILQVNGYNISEFTHENFVSYIENFFDTPQYRWVWRKEVRKVANFDEFYKTSLCFSILLSADKGECIFDGVIYKRKNKHLSSKLVDNYRSVKFGQPKSALNKLRNKVYEQACLSLEDLNQHDRFLSINVPTGIGKTLTVLNVALKLLEKRQKLEKIIYCLPFTSIIDQNAGVIKELLELNGLDENSENLLVKHHLSELVYNSDEDEIDDNRGEYLVHQFESNINVTTFYQLLNGIFSGKNREVRKLQSFANSIIILDEVQSIPSKYWPLVNTVFKELAQRLNITFILVTATMPMIFSEEKDEIKELVKQKRKIFQSPSLDRIDLNSSLLKDDLTKDKFIRLLKQDIKSNENRSFLIILNTIQASKDIFSKLRDEEFTNLKYLSTNITPKERYKRIKQIKNAKQPCIVVSTQLVEAGVDIDLDIVYRDLAPLDSIFQAAGRCNRNNADEKGIVKIFSLLDGDKKYSSYIYSKADLILTRDLLLQKNSYREGEFFELANLYYNEIVKDTDASKFILKEINKLNYSNAFDRNANSQAFQLIEEYPTYPAYVAFEKEAQELKEQYEELLDKEFDDPFDKKRVINNQLRKMNQYMVNVPEKYAYEKKHQEHFFYLISDKNLDFAYDPETGIEYEQEQGIFT